MDPMKSDFLIKRNKRGKKVKEFFIKGKGEKRKGIQSYYSLSHFEFWRALKVEGLGFR